MGINNTYFNQPYCLYLNHQQKFAVAINLNVNHFALKNR